MQIKFKPVKLNQQRKFEKYEESLILKIIRLDDLLILLIEFIMDDEFKIARMFYYVFNSLGLLFSLWKKHDLFRYSIILVFLLTSYFYHRCHTICTYAPVDEITKAEEGYPQKYFCNICKKFCRYRTKHCKLCRNCILKYDHHCFWIGNCVGEKNHGHFYLFLFLQTVLSALFLQVLLQDDLPFKFRIAMSVFEIGIFFFTVTCSDQGFLWVYHSILIATNRTTWEHMSRKKINYLQKGYNPFNHGFLVNLRQTFCLPKEPMQRWIISEWTVPPIELAQILDQGDWFQNKYYSCF